MYIIVADEVKKYKVLTLLKKTKLVRVDNHLNQWHFCSKMQVNH